MQILPSAGFFLLFYQYLHNRRTPLRGSSHLVSPFTNDEQKEAAGHDACDLSATDSGLVRDVIDTDLWTQNGLSHGGVFTTFKRRFVTHNNRGSQRI